MQQGLTTASIRAAEDVPVVTEKDLDLTAPARGVAREIGVVLDEIHTAAGRGLTAEVLRLSGRLAILHSSVNL